MTVIKLPCWMSQELFGLRWRIVIEAVLLCIMACAPLISAKFSQYAIDDVIGARSVDNFRSLLIFCGLFIVIFLSLKYLTAWISASTRQRFALDVRRHLWGRWIRRAELSGQVAGEISNRLIGDVYSSGDAVITALSTVFVSCGILCVCLVMLFRCNHVVAWVALSFIPVYLVIYLAFGKRVQYATKSSLSAADSIVRFIVHRWTNIDEIRTLHGEHDERMRFDGMAVDLFNAGQRMLFVKNIAGGVSETAMVAWNLFLFSVGAYLVLCGSLTLGELVSVQMIAAQIVSPVQRLLHLGLSIKTLKVKVQRVIDVDCKCKDIEEPIRTGAEECNDIDLADVVCHSAVKGGTPPISLHLHLKSGQRYYIEGRNGSGKSSICRLMAGLRIPASGTVFVNGRVLSAEGVRGLRSCLILMTCRPFFFSGTIRDNLHYGLECSPKDDELRSALNRVGLDSWIDKLPFGLDFRIEDEGVNLSSGQRQRLHCARALLRTGRIVIVDEALSGIGECGEGQMLDLLNKGRALIVTQIGPSPVPSVKVG